MTRISLKIEEMNSLKNRLSNISKQIHSLESDIVRSLGQLDWEVSNKEAIRDQISMARRKASKLADKSSQMNIIIGRVINDFTATDRRIISKQKEAAGLLEKVWKEFLVLSSRLFKQVDKIGLLLIGAFKKAGLLFQNKPNEITIANLKLLSNAIGLTNISIAPIFNIVLGNSLRKRIKIMPPPKNTQQKIKSPSVGINNKVRKPLEIDKAIRGVKGDQNIIKGQGYLSLMGFLIGRTGPNKNGVDAKWGSQGKAGTKLFQQMMGLHPTGQLDTKTLTKMKECTDKGMTFKELIKISYKEGFRPEIRKGMTQAERLNVVYFYAILDEEKSGVPASITVAQCLQESNVGSSIPVDKKTGGYSYNMFGIKATKDWLKNGGDYVVSKTWEHRSGKDVTENHKFRAYDNYLESISDHSKVLRSNKRYKSLFSIKKDDNYLMNWATGLQKCGYATDQNYSKNLIRIINVYGLK